MIKYILELWNPITRKYEKVWEGRSHERAFIMFYKPSNARSTRRIIEIVSEQLYHKKANE